jgi:predicted phosphoadenosine phosphosulfate sulfurtransferase
MKHILLFIVVFSFFQISCEDSSKKEIQVIFDKVMLVHDSTMVKMDNIHELKKQLTKSFSPGMDSTIIFDGIEKLDDADEAMMVWMAEFNAEYTSMKPDDQKTYLNTEMEKIEKVKTILLASISNANQLVSKSKNEK